MFKQGSLKNSSCHETNENQNIILKQMKTKRHFITNERCFFISCDFVNKCEKTNILIKPLIMSLINDKTN